MTHPWLVSYFCAMSSRSAAVSVRGVRPGDVGRLQAIQLAAGDAFRHVGMSAVAESPPLPAESLSGYRKAGRAWAAVDDHDEPVGFVVADVVDGAAHIEQVSVHPAHARQRIGAMLLNHVAVWAVHQGLPALTLVTFRGVPWNARITSGSASASWTRPKSRPAWPRAGPPTQAPGGIATHASACAGT